MLPLSIQDPQLNDRVRLTLSKLLTNGVRSVGAHHLPASTRSRIGLSDAELSALVSAGVAEVVSRQSGQVLRHMAGVASEVELFDNGDAAITLSFDLTP